MINLLIGPPGGGKSYEAVAFHVLPALAAGRKVITNLPLNLDNIAEINSDYLGLINIKQSTAKLRPIERAENGYSRFTGPKVRFNNSAFANVEDYGDSWRHPDSGAGPLYVIDECHIPLPAKGTGLDVEHWYSLHRHESADVLLMTQSYGKINPAIKDLIQICYKVKKNTAFGSSSSYIRKVQDGIRGDVVNTSIRKYDKKYFGLYQSHTKGGGSELAANDIIPIWRRWPILGAGLMFAIFAVMVFSGAFKNPMNTKSYNKTANAVESQSVDSSAPAINTVPVPAGLPAPIISTVATKDKTEVEKDPYSENGIHILGHVSSKEKTLWFFTLSQNGQKLKNIKSSDLLQVGYSFQQINDCAAWITFGKVKRFIKCDSPSVSVTPTNAITN
jgi:zona occludens toxin